MTIIETIEIVETNQPHVRLSALHRRPCDPRRQALRVLRGPGQKTGNLPEGTEHSNGV